MRRPPTTAPAAAPSGARNIGTIAAIVALVGFLLPWVSCNAVGWQTASGLDLASQGDLHALWLIPLGMIAAVILLWTKRPATGLACLAVGIGSAAIMLYYYAKLESSPRGQFGFGQAIRQAFEIEYGAVISLAASIVVAVCGAGLHRAATVRERS